MEVKLKLNLKAIWRHFKKFALFIWISFFEFFMINVIHVVFRILERTGARALSGHLRKFCDYLVFEFTMSRGEQHVNKCVDALNDMIWKYNIVTIDRLVLCLVCWIPFIRIILRIYYISMRFFRYLSSLQICASTIPGFENTRRKWSSSLLLHHTTFASESCWIP